MADAPRDGETGYLTPRMMRWRARTGGPLTVLAIGSLPLLALDFVRADLTDADRLFIDAVDVVVLVAFTVDFLVQLAMTPRRARFVRAEWVEVMLVVTQVLAVVPALTHLGWFRLLRAGRPARVVVGLAEVITVSGLTSDRGREFLRRHSARFALSLAGFAWIASAVAFTIAEDIPGAGGNDSFGDGMWWSLTTITSVGYGDLTPATTAGRIVGAITMIIGVATFAVFTASVAEFLLRSKEADQASENADESGPGEASGPTDSGPASTAEHAFASGPTPTTGSRVATAPEPTAESGRL